MITENIRGEELFREVAKDFRISVKRKITDERNKLREPYLKSRTNIVEPLWHRFTYDSPRYIKWYILTGMVGDYKLPKAINHHHCSVNVGWNGKKLYIIYRGNKTTQALKMTNGGYIVTMGPKLFKRMRERNRDIFGEIKDNDRLCEKIFLGDETGVYYDFDWTKFAEEQKEVPSSLDILAQQEAESSRPQWLRKGEKLKVEEHPIVLRTSSGVYLGYVTDDRAEVRLKTYISERELIQPEMKILIDQFLDHVYILYNQELFDEPQIRKSQQILDEYLGKDEVVVYRLTI